MSFLAKVLVVFLVIVMVVSLASFCYKFSDNILDRLSPDKDPSEIRLGCKGETHATLQICVERGTI